MQAFPSSPLNRWGNRGSRGNCPRAQPGSHRLSHLSSYSPRFHRVPRTQSNRGLFSQEVPETAWQTGCSDKKSLKSNSWLCGTQVWLGRKSPLDKEPRLSGKEETNCPPPGAERVGPREPGCGPQFEGGQKEWLQHPAAVPRTVMAKLGRVAHVTTEEPRPREP